MTDKRPILLVFEVRLALYISSNFSLNTFLFLYKLVFARNTLGNNVRKAKVSLEASALNFNVIKTVLNFWRPFVWPLFFGLQNDTFKI